MKVTLFIKYKKDFDYWEIEAVSDHGRSYLGKFDNRTSAHMAATSIERLAIDTQLFSVTVKEAIE